MRTASIASDPDIGAQPDFAGPDGKRWVCQVRVLVGAMLERRACALWQQPLRGMSRARVMSDAYLAALWTSCNAEYVLQCDEACQLKLDDVCLQSIPCQHNLLSMVHSCDVFSAHSSCRQRASREDMCGRGIVSLLERASSRASRGWLIALTRILGSSPGHLYTLRHLLLACITGMTACTEPTRRPTWAQRSSALRVAQRELCSRTVKEVALAHAMPVRCALQFYRAVVMESAIAMRKALLCNGNGQPAHVGVPPRACPRSSIAQTMARFASVGGLLADCDNARSARQAIDCAFAGFNVVGKDCSAPVAHSLPNCTEYESFAHAGQRLSAEGLFANYALIWNASNVRGRRAPSLLPAEYGALNDLAPAQRLCAAIPSKVASVVQQVVFNCPAIGIGTAQEAYMRLFGGCAFARRREEGTLAVFGCGAKGGTLREDTRSAREAAIFVAASQMAHVFETALAMQIGPTAARLQACAVLHHFSVDDTALDFGTWTDEAIAAAIERLPAHSTNLMVCTACRRIANCIPGRNGDCSKMLYEGAELGMVACAVDAAQTPCTARQTAVYCARRVPTQTNAHAADDRDACRTDDDVSVALSRSEDTQMRRECKRGALRAANPHACGDVPLVQFKLLGSVVRILGNWYTLCTLCGSVTTVGLGSASAIGANLACRRCIAQSLVADFSGGDVCARKRARSATSLSSSKQIDARRRCRFCGIAPDRVQFVSHASPRDTFASNAHSVPGQRVTFWCVKHTRPWLGLALAHMDTPLVLAHIIQNAEPDLASFCARSASANAQQQPANTATTPMRTVKRLQGRAKRLSQDAVFQARVSPKRSRQL